MLAGLILPGRPVGNMYFAAWSHNVISNAVSLSQDLKMGEYRESPHRSFSYKSCVLNLSFSQNPSTDNVHNTDIWYNSWWLHQLRHYDIYCFKQSRASGRRKWKLILEWCKYTILQHQCRIMGPGSLYLQGWDPIRGSTYWFSRWRRCCGCSPYHLSRK